MSLEQALIENTAAVKQLIAVLSSAVEAGGVEVPAGDTTAADTGATEGGKRKRRTKAEIEADNAALAAQAAAAAAAAQPATVGNAQPAVTQAAPAAQVAATPSDSPAVASAASTAPQSATQAVTMNSITDKLKALHARDGNAGVKKVLDHFGVARVPELAGKDLVTVDAVVEGLLNPAADASLFG